MLLDDFYKTQYDKIMDAIENTDNCTFGTIWRVRRDKELQCMAKTLGYDAKDVEIDLVTTLLTLVSQGQINVDKGVYSINECNELSWKDLRVYMNGDLMNDIRYKIKKILVSELDEPCDWCVNADQNGNCLIDRVTCNYQIDYEAYNAITEKIYKIYINDIGGR